MNNDMHCNLASPPEPPTQEDPEARLWLCPVEDRRPQAAPREGMIEGLTLGHYLQLVDFTGRLLWNGKAAIGSEVAVLFDRLKTSAEAWQSRLDKLRGGRLLGRFAAARRNALRAVAARLGVQRLANLQLSSTG